MTKETQDKVFAILIARNYPAYLQALSTIKQMRANFENAWHRFIEQHPLFKRFIFDIAKINETKLSKELLEKGIFTTNIREKQTNIEPFSGQIFINQLFHATFSHSEEDLERLDINSRIIKMTISFLPHPTNQS